MNIKNLDNSEAMETLYCGRRPKNDSIEPSVPLSNDEEDEEEEEEEEDLDEEVNFDKPTFKRDQIWNDYAEDLDYDQ